MSVTVEKIEKTQELMKSLVTKAWESADFKEQLINNPKETIESVTGTEISIPEGFKIIVVDQTASNTVYINIPTKPNLDEMELTDEQLEMVAGGDWSDVGWNPVKMLGYGIHKTVDWFWGGYNV
jgi:hypothetical protein